MHCTALTRFFLEIGIKKESWETINRSNDNKTHPFYNENVQSDFTAKQWMVKVSLLHSPLMVALCQSVNAIPIFKFN